MRILLSGFGVVGRAEVQLLEEQRATLYSKHGLSPSFVGVIDSKGAAIDPRGLDTAQLLETKEKQGTVGAIHSGKRSVTWVGQNGVASCPVTGSTVARTIPAGMGKSA